jgi:hypothetical protein
VYFLCCQLFWWELFNNSEHGNFYYRHMTISTNYTRLGSLYVFNYFRRIYSLHLSDWTEHFGCIFIENQNKHQNDHFIVMPSQTLLHVSAYQPHHQGANMILTSYLWLNITIKSSFWYICWFSTKIFFYSCFSRASMISSSHIPCLFRYSICHNTTSRVSANPLDIPLLE